MEDDVDIYADLPSFSLNPENNDQNCNCNELKKELNSLISKLENVEGMKANLEKNLSSLLKTARAEIARKDKMINNLRKQLDDITFRRSNRNEAPGFSTHRLSHQHTVTSKKYENVSTHLQENETESHQIQFHHDEYKNKKPQTDVNQITTVFGERLQKRIMENEKEEKKQKELLKLSVETKTKDIPKNNVENNKENGSQFSISNNNESNIEPCSTSEPLEKNSYKKNLMKRTNEEDDTRRHKRLKIENNEETTNKESDYNYFTRYDLTNDPAQHEMKNSLTTFEDRTNAAHFFKKEGIPLCAGRRAASEYRDMKHDQSNRSNRSKNDAKNNSARDHDSSNVNNDRVDSLRNSRAASTSNHVSEEFNNSYKKNGYRHSPSRRSYSRSRSDYESSSSHRLRERSRRTYREKKYDDYKYDSRYKNSRLKRNHESEENDGKTRYRRGERDGLWDRSRYSSSDNEDRESNSSHKNKKYDNRRLKKETVNDKKLHENNKVAEEINFRESSSRTIVNSVTNYGVGKNIEQHKVKNDSEVESKNSIESTSAHIIMKILDTLEEGEILDSPEKKNNSAKIFKDNKMKENNVKNVSVEDKNENISVNVSTDDKSTSFQNDTNSTKQSEVADINTKKIEVASCLLQENSKDCGKVIQLSSSKNDMAVEVYNCRKNEDLCKSYINEDLMDSIAQNIGAIEQVRDTDIDDDKNDVDKTSKDLIIEIVTETAKIKETIASNIKSIIKIKKLEDPKNIESATKKEEMDNPNSESVVEITEVSNFNSNNKIDELSDELRTSTVKTVTNVKVIPCCDIEDKSQTPIEGEILQQMSNSKSNVEMCLNDHNYVQTPIINVSDDLDTIQKPSSRSECDEAVPEATPKKTKVEKVNNVQSVNSVKRTVSSIVKKNDEQSKGILISHRRKAVILSDSNASMTVLMNTNTAKTSSSVNNCDENDSASKPRACKTLRVKLTRCKNM